MIIYYYVVTYVLIAVLLILPYFILMIKNIAHSHHYERSTSGPAFQVQ